MPRRASGKLMLKNARKGPAPRVRAAPTKRDRRASEHLECVAERAFTPQQHQQIVAEHRGGQNHGRGYGRIEELATPNTRHGKQTAERYAQHACKHGGEQSHLEGQQ